MIRCSPSTFLWRLLGFTTALAFAMCARSSSAQQPFELDVKPPELVGGPWLNTVRNAPVKLASRQGNVTIVEFWTFG